MVPTVSTQGTGLRKVVLSQPQFDKLLLWAYLHFQKSNTSTIATNYPLPPLVWIPIDETGGEFSAAVTSQAQLRCKFMPLRGCKPVSVHVDKV